MNTLVHRADERGYVNHGWLKTFHSFSFAGYFDPNKMGFGALRVLNDDTVQGGMGFASHSHDNMEIISIPLQGALAHSDNHGNEQVIHNNEVQVMSAGTGITHSETNASRTEQVNFLQIWILPKEKNIEPRYDQKIFSANERENEWQTIVSPKQNSNSLRINQDAMISRASLSKDSMIEYTAHYENTGFYLFVIEGDVKVKDLRLTRRDGLGITKTNEVAITAFTNSDVLLLELPMNV
ncbi:MAG: pirin family protein [Calditrichaceae bacterium]|jgi:quercetin 2,3-dioxygenase